MIILQILMIPLVVVILLGIVIISLTSGTGLQDNDSHTGKSIIDGSSSITEVSTTSASLESQLLLFKIAYPLSALPASDANPETLHYGPACTKNIITMEVEQ